jgi:hypothetical protein
MKYVEPRLSNEIRDRELKKSWCELWGFYDGDVSSRGRLGCDAV